jgi:4-hydroxybenzoate polyprenyltransferase
MDSVLRVIKDFFNVSRLEYAYAEFPATLIPLFLGTSTLAGLLNPLWFVSVVAFVLLYSAGFVINSYNDTSLDLKWNPRVGNSSQRMGKKKLLSIVVLQVLISFAISVYISYVLNAWFISALISLMIFFGAAYSLPPLHLKVRGIWHVVAMSLSLFAIPFVFLFYVVMGSLSIPILILLVGFTITHYAMTLANQSRDYIGDKVEGLKTPAVLWGLRRTLTIASFITVMGFLIMVSGIFELILTSPWLAKFETETSSLPFPGRYLLMSVIVVPMIFGYSISMRGLFDLRKISISKKSIKEQMKNINDRMNYPKWHAGGILGLVIASLIIFSIKILI